MAYEPTQARRIAAGLCKDCGEERGPTGTTRFCRPCADHHSKRQAERKKNLRAKWAETGLACNNCGARLPDERYKNCVQCREKARERYGARGAEYRRSRRGTGFCVACSEPSIPGGGNYCRTHWLDNGAKKYGFTREQYPALWEKLEKQQFRCYYTGIELIPGVNASLDHKKPRSKGGDMNDLDNCVWCDRLINAFKNDLTDEEFVERCRQVVNRLG